MSYDPRAHGCRCDVCPLKGHTPVPPEWGTSIGKSTNPAIVLVGEAPGEQEERTGRPFVGRAGEELDKSLTLGGMSRRDLLVTHVLLCRPPKGRLRELMQQINKNNREEMRRFKNEAKAFHRGETFAPPRPAELIEDPIECCKPRLEKEIAGFKHFITLGKTATAAITGTTVKLMDLRGGLMLLDGTERTPERKVMPTITPGFCTVNPRWFDAFYNDISKAGKWFRGEVSWNPPKMLQQPTPAQLRAYLESKGTKILAHDLETDGREPLEAKIRCLVIGDTVDCVGLSFMSKDPPFVRFYAPEMERQILEVLQWYFENAELPKLTWNGITYDAQVILSQWGFVVRNHIDGILIQKGVASEMPRSLAHSVSMLEYAPSWKVNRQGQKIALGGESDQQLVEYCANDTALTARILDPLVQEMVARNQQHVVASDHRVQEVCRGMHEVGMYVDQKKRAAKEKELLRRRQELLTELRDRICNPKFNPGSVYQVRDILFGKWDLEPALDAKDRLTASDDPSTSDLVLRALLTQKSVPKDQRDFIKALRYYRKVMKVLGTYVVKMRPNNVSIESDLGWDEDDDWIDKETRERYGLQKMGIVDPRTSRMHPGWSSALPVTGRLSSFNPMNAMNYPHPLRGLVTCQPGNVLVGADADQLEIRVAAAVWQIEKYLLAFREGKDPHSMTAFMIFKEEFCKKAGISPDQFERPGKLVGKAYDEHGTFIGKGEVKGLRSLSKGVHFASIAAGEKVATIGEKHETPIEELKIGDWVWAWSLARKRYEPTQVKNVWDHGQKKCIKLTLGWGNGNQRRTTVTVTPDHPFLSRDGTFRHAGSLRVGDSLMPFTRRAIKAAQANPAGDATSYFYVHPFNDERIVGAHRVVKGFYNPGEGHIHVHHKNRDTLDNRPDNLEPLPSYVHYMEHNAERTAARLRSPNWWRGILFKYGPAERREAAKKTWVKRKANREHDRTFGLKPSKLDPWADQIGKLPDAEIAALASCTPEAVAYYRKQRGVAPPVGQRGWLRWLLLEDPRWRRLLCEYSSQEIIEAVNAEYGTSFRRSGVNQARRAAGIPAPSRKDKGVRKPSKLDGWADRIGREPDAGIAREAGVTAASVSYYRKVRGIPKFTGKTWSNHRVLAIEEVGLRNVWDIEVDHEDHNFALASGIFVHNSQYMAGDERVHAMIQSTEVDSDKGDGTTDLPYALLPLKRVRKMRREWLNGAPEYKEGWAKELAEFDMQKFLVEPVGGRRRDFLDSHRDEIAGNEIVNFKIQGAAAAWMNKALLEIAEQIRPNEWGPGTGIINQCHDHIVVECPEKEAKRVAGLIEEALNGTHPGLPGVNLTASADIGPSWDKV